jgi:flagellar basal-body rod modification protein FlgD
MNNVTTSKTPVNNTNVDRDGFLKLFIESLKIQDPMEPMKQGEMMAQLTQLTMIETMANMKATVDTMIEGMNGSNPLANYVGLMGMKVKVENEAGTDEGVVISVGRQGKAYVFEMANGNAYDVKDIVGITNTSATVVEPK